MKSSKHIHGLDYARALFSAFVVIWHTHAFPAPSVWSISDAAKYRPSFTDIANYYLLLQAVPVFIAISCYLYISRGGGIDLLSRRIKRLVGLMLFWGLANLVFFESIAGISRGWAAIQASPFIFTAQGFGSIYYFFFALSVTLAVCEIVLRMKTAVVVLSLVVGMFATAAFNWSAVAGHNIDLQAFWSPFNYLSFPPAITLLIRYQDQLRKNIASFVGVMLVLCAIASAVEWGTLVHVNTDAPLVGSIGFPEYGRVSVLFESIAILSLCLAIKREAPFFIRYASRQSLSLYCLHPFVLALIGSFVQVPYLPLATLMGIVGSYVAAEILSRFVLRPSILSLDRQAASGNRLSHDPGATIPRSAPSHKL
ncbi:acyltransferase [Paraburkholderia sp. SARCC-3016]|uniref:acyltransferase n=1 Tax=Paraburkholderia sp. SARCC-3016 TaxID=3058611 RepID=UPI0028083C35|nr:acyltransferase [Paraburkholderia sp. SARCC-3016]MDQ7977153.1 acyltransferase [Paraburkholderia sp. SARCC-3016]